jgi:hypothetical protein
MEVEGYNELKDYKPGDRYIGRDGITRKVIQRERSTDHQCFGCDNAHHKPKCSWRFSYKAGAIPLEYKVCAVKEQS